MESDVPTLPLLTPAEEDASEALELPSRGLRLHPESPVLMHVFL